MVKLNMGSNSEAIGVMAIIKDGVIQGYTISLEELAMNMSALNGVDYGRVPELVSGEPVSQPDHVDALIIPEMDAALQGELDDVDRLIAWAAKKGTYAAKTWAFNEIHVIWDTWVKRAWEIDAAWAAHDAAQDAMEQDAAVSEQQFREGIEFIDACRRLGWEPSTQQVNDYVYGGELS